MIKIAHLQALFACFVVVVERVVSAWMDGAKVSKPCAGGQICDFGHRITVNLFNH
jgi:hypothetical protein